MHKKPRKTKEGRSMDQILYVASQDAQGAILRMTLDENGQLTLVDRTPAERAAYLCIEKNRLYALLREPFQMQSGVASYEILPDGSLRPDGPVQPVHGTISAHIWAKGGDVYTANYLSGSVTRLPHDLLAFGGSGIHPDRQTCSHPHCLTPTPDGLYLCVCDLGADCIHICSMDLTVISQSYTTPGSGPRHLVFSPDGKHAYCANELDSSVSVFSYERAKLTLLHTQSTLTHGFKAENAASAIRLSPEGDRLYVSNRGHDSVCVYEVHGAFLTPIAWIPCGGHSPREMMLMGKWLLCGNELSHDICVLPADGNEKTQPVCRFPVIRPWCILPR